MHTAKVRIIVRQAVEQRRRQIDAPSNTALAFVHHLGLRGLPRGGIVNRQSPVAVRVPIRLGTHEGERQRDPVPVWVDVGAAGAKAAVVEGDVAFAGGVGAFACSAVGG